MQEPSDVGYKHTIGLLLLGWIFIQGKAVVNSGKFDA
jgi:hypothetical protein